MRKAFGALKNTRGGQGGRLTNHERVVRQVLLTVVSDALPKRSLSATAADLGVYARDLREYRSAREILRASKLRGNPLT